MPSRAPPTTPVLLPLRRCPPDALAGVRGVLTDLDGTLTTGGKLGTAAYAALAALKEAGLFVAVVTGRPAGWGELVARTFPVDACVVENGGLTFQRDRRGRLTRRYYRPDERGRAADRRRLTRLCNQVCAATGARLSGDSRYTEVDLALDWNEDARLSPRAARDIERRCRAAGASAVRSSIHVNVWYGGFDKLSACSALLTEVAGARLPLDLGRYAYVGDAPNDSPMFGAFPLSFGVADVRDCKDELSPPPAYVTRARGGRGFCEVAAAILLAKG